uniref:Kin17_mid domain-containing protein n=1 Tax=Angiostrongylus cantonensis TaxID=6313 RepID=A0A0K0DH02_ANGCA
MGKHERGTPKDIANRIKSKGLQKLRWFCQMCQKQCRDQNGFKCHLTSESHQRQLLLVAENTGTYLRQFSKQFEANFMQILKACFGTKRVRANEVYQEYIKDKGHVHMNSTVWHTLTGFVHYLGSSGKCRIDQNEKEEVLRRAEEAKRMKAEKDDEERQQEMINERTKKEEVESDAEPSDSRRKGQERENSRREWKDRHMKRTREYRSRSRSQDGKRRMSSPRRAKERPLLRSKKEEKPKKSALDEIREQQERSKEKKNRRDHWLHEGIIVKVITKKLGEKYYKSKGVVMTLIDDYVASLKLDDGVLVKLDQSHVETVIPSVGREMKIVNGAYRGCIAVSTIN